MTVMGQDKMTPDEALAHYGVLGMKWGVTRAKGGGREIRRARRDVGRKASDYHDQNDAVARAKKLAPKTTDAEKKKLEKKRLEFMDSPDRVLASRLTRGEKATVLILGNLGGVAIVAGSSAASRRIEYKQDRGGYAKAATSSPKITAKPGVSAVTKKVITDHNNLSDNEFRQKYATSKSTYAKRVEKYGDPYMKSPLAKVGKKLGSKN